MIQVYKINDFEGPLDLLLHLIKDNKMDIFDVEISLLIDQYLEYIDEAKKINLEIASDFLVMASTLLEIKSKLLLPKPELEIDSEYEEDNQEQLVKKLIEYKKYKDVVESFKDLNKERSLYYTKPLEDLSSYNVSSEVNLPDDVELYDLLSAMEKMSQRLKIKQPLSAIMENNEISVETRMETIIKQLDKAKNGKVELIEIIDINTKPYVIVTFLALLDLAKQRRVLITQDYGFDKIYIEEVK